MTNIQGPPIMEHRGYEFYYDQDISNIGVYHHSHTFYEVLFFISGSIKYVVESTTYSLRAGDLLLTCPNDFHHFVPILGNKCARYFLWLAPSFLDEISQDGNDLGACFRQSGSHYKMVRLDSAGMKFFSHHCQKILQASQDHGFGSYSLIKAYITEYLVFLNRSFFNNTNIDSILCDIVEDERVNRIVEHINNHLADPFSLEMLASSFFLSKHYLNTLFKKHTGLSVYQLVIKKRLAFAYNQILSGEPIVKACYSAGFSDYSNFLKLFKREYSRLPKELRRNSFTATHWSDAQ